MEVAYLDGVFILFFLQRPTVTGSSNDVSTSTQGDVGSSQPGILTALHTLINLELERHLHGSQLDFAPLTNTSIQSTTGGSHQDLQKPFLPSESHISKDIDSAGGKTNSGCAATHEALCTVSALVGDVYHHWWITCCSKSFSVFDCLKLFTYIPVGREQIRCFVLSVRIALVLQVVQSDELKEANSGVS